MRRGVFRERELICQEDSGRKIDLEELQELSDEGTSNINAQPEEETPVEPVDESLPLKSCSLLSISCTPEPEPHRVVITILKLKYKHINNQHKLKELTTYRSPYNPQVRPYFEYKSCASNSTGLILPYTLICTFLKSHPDSSKSPH